MSGQSAGGIQGQGSRAEASHPDSLAVGMRSAYNSVEARPVVGNADSSDLRVGGRRDNPPANASPRWVHTVKPFLDLCGAGLQFSCHAPDGAPCRLDGSCSLIAWITADDPFFWYDGPRTALRHGSIEFFEGDPGLRWRYQTQVPRGHPIRDGAAQSVTTPTNPINERSHTHARPVRPNANHRLVSRYQ